MARAKKPDIMEVVKDVEAASMRSMVQRLKTENLRLTRNNKDLLKQTVYLEDLLGFSDAISAPTNELYWSHEEIRGKGKYVAIVNLSDWHVGEVVTKSMTGGLNEFNSAIAEHRAKRCFQKICDYIERHTPGASELWMGWLGDFISGYIHDELVESNSMSPVEETMFAMDLLENGLNYILKRLLIKRITIVCKPGNHGRTTQKMRVSTSNQNSYEWMMYQQIAKHFAKEKRVKFIIDDSYRTVVPICGRNVGFHHGEAIKYQGGIGGITIPAARKLANWNEAKAVVLDNFGHHHTSLFGGNFASNGSLIGYGPFSLKIGAKFEPPSQTFIGFSQSRGAYLVSKMFCEE